MKRWVISRGPTDNTKGHTTVREEGDGITYGREVAQFYRREDAEAAVRTRNYCIAGATPGSLLEGLVSGVTKITA